MTLNKPARVNSGKSGETIANAILDEAVRAAVKLLRRFDRFYFRCVGEWLSLVEHLVRDQGVGGSNPLSPTNLSLANLGYANYLATLGRFEEAISRVHQAYALDPISPAGRPEGLWIYFFSG